METRKILLLLGLLFGAAVLSGATAHAEVPSRAAWEDLEYSRCFHADSCTWNHEAIRFRLHPGDIRAEAMDPFYVFYENEAVLHFSFRIPAGTRLTNEHQAIVLAQFHALNGMSPSFAFRYKNGRDLVITVRHHVSDAEDVQGEEVIVYSGLLALGEWHDFRVRVHAGPKGLLEVFRAGEPFARYEGPLGYLGLANYFKIGLYDFTAGLKEDFLVEYRRYWREP